MSRFAPGDLEAEVLKDGGGGGHVVFAVGHWRAGVAARAFDRRSSRMSRESVAWVTCMPFVSSLRRSSSWLVTVAFTRRSLIAF